MLRFEWDQDKDEINRRKHRIGFETAQLVFDDPHCLTFVERVEDGEQRWHAIGAVSIESGTDPVLVVVHVYRHPVDEDLSPGTPREDNHGEEIIRIISARRAEKHEYRRYQEQIVD